MNRSFCFRCSVVAMILVSSAIIGCYVHDPTLSNRRHVTLYASDGSVIGRWATTDRPNGQGGWWSFTDESTGETVRISGTVVVEPIVRSVPKD